VRTFAGIDLGSAMCRLSVVNERGEVVFHTSFTPDPQGVRAILPELGRMAGRWRQRMQVAVEDPTALVTSALAQDGYQVIAVHPVALARFRLRLAPSRAKSDEGDSRALAELVRLEPGRHRPLPAHSPEIQALRVMTRARTDAMHRRSRLQRVMRATLTQYYPNAVAAFRDLGMRDALATLRLAPTPRAARRLTATRLSAALRAAGRRKTVRSGAEDILGVLRKPQLRVRPLEESAYGSCLLGMLDELETLNRTLESLESACLAAAAQHPHWPIYASFPGLGSVVGATLLAEIGDDPGRFASARGLLAFAGVAPVTRASGVSVYVSRRRIHSRHLGDATLRWGAALLLHSRPALARYRDRREIGDSHFSALRRVLAQQLAALHACLRDGRRYDEERFLVDRPQLHAQVVAAALGQQPSKYEQLRIELAKQWPAEVSLSFRDIERLVRGGLPRSAYDHSAWWIKRDLANSTQARAWYGAGYRVGCADEKQQLVRFNAIEAPLFRDSADTTARTASTETGSVEVIHNLS
jgi:transposase